MSDAQSPRDPDRMADRIPVVAAAIVDDAGRLLAARRTEPAELAGGWELPGGKVEPGETDIAALEREIDEELGVRVQVGAQVGEGWPMGERYLLRVYLARIPSGEPQPLEEHDELRWLAPGDWWSVEWLAADMPVVRLLQETDHRVDQGSGSARS